MKIFKIIVCFTLGLIVFLAMLIGIAEWFDYFNTPNWLRYTLALPSFALSVFAGWAMWRQSLKEFEVDIAEE